MHSPPVETFCPVCHGLIPKDAAVCMWCGSKLDPDLPGEDGAPGEVSSEDSVARVPPDDGENPEGYPSSDIDSIFLCTNCGAFVAAGAPRCPVCDARFEEPSLLEGRPPEAQDRPPAPDASASEPGEPQETLARPETMEVQPGSNEAKVDPGEGEGRDEDADTLDHVRDTSSGAPWTEAEMDRDERSTPPPPEDHIIPTGRVGRGWKKAFTFDLPPAEHMGPAIAAAAIGLFASRSFGQDAAGWALAFALAAFSSYAMAASYPSWRPKLRAADSALLIAGASMAWLAFAVYASFGGGTELLALLAVAGTIPLAWATRRLLRTPACPLLAASAGFSLIGLAVASAHRMAFAASPAWSVAVLAAIPWPVAVGLEEIRRRRRANAIRTALAGAQGDYARRNLEETVAGYDRAIHLTDEGIAPVDLPWYGKGAALVLLGRYEEALRAVDRALDINPKNEVAWLNKGNALMRVGRVLDALRCFNAAIKVNAAYEVAWNNKGNALARLGRHEEALRCYDQALAIDPRYRDAWANKGYVLTRLGRYEEAAACADHVIPLVRSARADAA